MAASAGNQATLVFTVAVNLPAGTQVDPLGDKLSDALKSVLSGTGGGTLLLTDIREGAPAQVIPTLPVLEAKQTPGSPPPPQVHNRWDLN